MKKISLRILSFIIPTLMILAMMSPKGYAETITELTFWGINSHGQCTVPEGLTGVTAIAAGRTNTLALKDDGTVVIWGDEEPASGWGEYDFIGPWPVPTGLTDVTAIAAGGYHNLALRGDGTVVGWGHDYDEQWLVLPDLTDVTAIAAGVHHDLALKEDGTVVAWGGNYFGECSVPSDLTGVVAIAAGRHQSVALKADGTVVVWGGDEGGAYTVPEGLTDVVAISAGYYHIVALKADGTVVDWGNKYYGQGPVPAGIAGVVAIASGGHHIVALMGDGTVVAWGNNQYGQCSVPEGLTGVTAIAAGGWHTVALSEKNVAEENVAPVVGAIAAPVDPKPINTPVVGFSATFEDQGVLDTHTATWDWGDGTTSDGIVTEADGSGAATGSHTYTSAGTYTVTLKVTDNEGAFSTATFEYIVVYDPSAGFVTGGGSIDSLPGYYTPDPTLEGKAVFAFVSKYQKGSSLPTGNTGFLFKAGDINFRSTTYQWLVVSGNATRAQFKGTGTINGAGSFGFVLTAIDKGDSADQFRIKIWDRNLDDVVIYDNRLGESDAATTLDPITSGNIVIHK